MGICRHGDSLCGYLPAWRQFVWVFAGMETVCVGICQHGKFVWVFAGMETVCVGICRHGDSLCGYLLAWRQFVWVFAGMLCVHTLGPLCPSVIYRPHHKEAVFGRFFPGGTPPSIFKFLFRGKSVCLDCCVYYVLSQPSYSCSDCP